MRHLKKWLVGMAYGFVRTTVGGYILGLCIPRLSFLFPMKMLRETDSIFAFYHPMPSYPFHVLLVPKRIIIEVNEIGGEESDILMDIFAVTASIVDEFDLDTKGFRLILNGGKYQDVSQLHFHLVSSSKNQFDLNSS